MCVVHGGDLTSGIACGNHPSVVSHAVVVHDMVCKDVIHERSPVFNSRFPSDILGLRISPLAVVIEPKFRIIHDFECAPEGDRTSVNDDTDVSSQPPCELGHAHVLLRMLLLRQRHGSSARILLRRVDTNDIFGQVPIDPPTFWYVVGGHVVVDLRLRFGWRNCPGFCRW